MERTDHIAFQGVGASLLADEFGLQRVPQEELVTPAAVKEWEHFTRYGQTVKGLFKPKPAASKVYDTVGCVALDRWGDVACGTSTGGITAKRVGCVGDCPRIGSGGYACNSVGGVSATGHGESIARVVLSQRVLQHRQTTGCSIQEAAGASLEYGSTALAASCASTWTAALASHTRQTSWRLRTCAKVLTREMRGAPC